MAVALLPAPQRPQPERARRFGLICSAPGQRDGREHQRAYLGPDVAGWPAGRTGGAAAGGRPLDAPDGPGRCWGGAGRAGGAAAGRGGRRAPPRRAGGGGRGRAGAAAAAGGRRDRGPGGAAAAGGRGRAARPGAASRASRAASAAGRAGAARASREPPWRAGRPGRRSRRRAGGGAWTAASRPETAVRIRPARRDRPGASRLAVGGTGRGTGRGGRLRSGRTRSGRLSRPRALRSPSAAGRPAPLAGRLPFARSGRLPLPAAAGCRYRGRGARDSR